MKKDCIVCFEKLGWWTGKVFRFETCGKCRGLYNRGYSVENIRSMSLSYTNKKRRN